MSDEKLIPNASTPAYYAIIPAVVRYDSVLRPNAKLLYGEISALASAGGYCYATNRYFAELYGFNIKTVGALIQSLAKAGYIYVEVIRGPNGAVDMRKIWLTAHTAMLCPPPHQKTDTPPSNNGEPPHQKTEKNNTSINNNTPIAPKIAPKVITDMLTEYASGNAKLLEALFNFAEMRAKIRAPISTGATVTLLLNKLDKLSGGSDAVRISMLNEATEKNWKSVYAPKDGIASKKVVESEDVPSW